MSVVLHRAGSCFKVVKAVLAVFFNHLVLMQALQHRADGKLYRIQTPQTPIARTKRYNTYKMDEFPSGMNMIVAVLAYTGKVGCLARGQEGSACHKICG